MSTRSAIARVHGDGFLGVYHHWDGYPTGLGKTLWDNTHKMPLKELLNLLIDQHPAGWSTIIERNLALPAGFQEITPGFSYQDALKKIQEKRNNSLPPECYCHGDRIEDAMPVDRNTDSGMEWAMCLTKLLTLWPCWKG